MGVQAVVGGELQARLGLPQASQLAQCQAAKSGVVGHSHCCSATGAVAVSRSAQFLRGAPTRPRGSVDSWPSCSGWHHPSVNVNSNSSGGRRGARVVCMARERRVKMVSQQIKREISEMLLYDKVLQATVLPETTLGADMYLTSVATISDVEISKDLSVAKVYISIYGDDRGQAKALEGLKSKAGYVRKGLAKRMNMKNTPEVRFIKDEALERGSRVITILDELKKERRLKEGKGLDDDVVETDEGDDVDEDYDASDNRKENEEESQSRRTSASKDEDEDEDSEWDDDMNITYIN